MTSRAQNLLVFLGFIIIAGLGYYLYSEQKSNNLIGSQINNQIAAEASLFLEHLNELETLSLSGDIFSDPRFTNLVDFSEPINPQPIGRANPFVTN